MSLAPCAPPIATLAAVPAEDIVILPPGTPWHVPWDLMMHGPFVSCGLLDGAFVRHVTVTSLLTSAVRRRSAPEVAVDPSDHPRLPVFAAEMTVIDAAVRVVETGWDLAVVLDHEPRVITARSVYRALVASEPHPGPPRSIRSTS